MSALKQSTGAAVYVDDMPKYMDELYCGIVWSTRAHAKVVQIDASEATKIPGVWGFIGAGDISGDESNKFRVSGVQDEVVFAEEVVYVMLTRMYTHIHSDTRVFSPIIPNHLSTQPM